MERRPKTTMRVIGGDLRGRLLEYDGDAHTRPMKDRVREAVFNLVGPAVREKRVIDLFAGTGALAIEALSRGATCAILIERRFPVADVIVRNLRSLNLAERAQVVTGDTFIWAARNTPPADRPWLVFCSPPYELYVSQRDSMLQLLDRFLRAAPDDSLLVMECDARFDTALLDALPAVTDSNSAPAGTASASWDIRVYAPAVIAIYHKRTSAAASPAP